MDNRCHVAHNEKENNRDQIISMLSPWSFLLKKINNNNYYFWKNKIKTFSKRKFL